MSFPKDFLWSGASADFQIEGGLTDGSRGLIAADFVTDGSNEAPRRLTYRLPDGSTHAVPMYESVPQDMIPYLDSSEYYPSHNAIDFYHHWEEDIELMKELGLKAYRFSVCWTRIFPTGCEEEPDEQGLQFYEGIIDRLVEAGIEPVVTICHDEIPVYLAVEYDGWLSRVTIDCYLKLCRALFERFGSKVHHWLTFNEINAVTGFPQLGIHDCSLASRYQALHHCMVASSLACKMAREMMDDCKMGTMISYSALYPITCKPEDVWASFDMRREKFYYFSDTMLRGGYPVWADQVRAAHDMQILEEPGDEEILRENTLDFIAISYYRSITGGEGVVPQNSHLVLSGGSNPYLKATDWGFPIDPTGLRLVLNELYDRYGKPIYVVENGLGAVDELEDGAVHDSYRMEYLGWHIEEIRKAIELDHVPVMGYALWSPTDLVSLSTGEMKKRYGLVYVDMDDKGGGSLKRIKKDSFEWYRRVIETNGSDLSMP